MSVEVTTLKSGINVVTDTMPHLETASLGVWVASGSRDERPDEHGISHLLEHMAFKGTRRRSARQIAEEIEAVGGDLNAATSAETTTYYARVLKADVPLALDVLADILSDPTFEPRRDHPRAERHRPGDRRRRRHAGRSDFRAFERHRLPGPAARPLHPRHRQDGAVVRRRHAARLSRPALSRARHRGGRGRRGRSRRGGRRRRAALCELHRSRQPAAGAGQIRRRQPRREARARTGAYRDGAARRRGDRSHAVQPPGVHQHPRRRNVVAAVPGGARAARPVLFDLFVPHAVFRHRHVRPLCRHRRRRHRGADARHRRRDRGHGRQHLRAGNRARPRRR